MKYFLVFCILFAGKSELFSQNQTDSLEMETTIGTVFLQNNSILSPKDLLYVMQLNEEAYNEMSIAISCRNSGIVLGMGGGFAVGFSIGRVISGREPNWVLAGFGVAGIVGSFALQSAFNTHARNAVTIYNSGLKPVSNRNTELNLVISGNGIGICIRF
jgi:hypothetical protein